MKSTRPVIVTVGGFLGSGKTSLILAAARTLQQRGVRCAAILNDQGGSLVDTELARQLALEADQVTGGCFCCRFTDLADAAERLLAHDPAVIFTEPVGSCTDISATVLQPLKSLYAAKFRLAPYTVLVDPERAAAFASGDAASDVAYLFRKQMEEADMVCITKADLAFDTAALPFEPAFRLSARTGAGVGEWLAEVLAGSGTAGRKLLDIDYTRYAQAEAALGWLNLEGEFLPRTPLSPALLVGPVLDRLDAALTAAGIEIAHLKMLDAAGGAYLKAAICRNGQDPDVEGDLAASPARLHSVLLNLRAAGDPAELRRMVEASLAELPGEWRDLEIESFRPAPPTPSHRYTEVAPAEP